MVAKISVKTDVYGKVDKTGARSYEMEVIGCIFSEFQLFTPEYEILKLDLNPNFKGIEIGSIGGSNIMTFTRSTVSGDRDIVSPIVALSSSYEFPINILSSGVISTVKQLNKKNPIIQTMMDGTIHLLIVVPGKNPNTVNEYHIRLPPNMRIDRKVVFIPKFNLYLTGCAIDILEEIRAEQLKGRNTNRNDPLVDITINTNVSQQKLIYFNFNGIFGRTALNLTNNPFSEVVVKVGAHTLKQQFNNSDFEEINKTIICSWAECNGINLLIDTNEERLSRTSVDIGKISSMFDGNTYDYINSLQEEIHKYQDNLKVKDQMISDLKAKLNKMEYDLKIEQEEYKTKREEIKYKSTIADQRHAGFMEAIKVLGALLGGVSLVIQLISKMQAQQANQSKQKNLMEACVSITDLIPKQYLIGIGAVSLATLAGIAIYNKLRDD